MRAPGKGSTVRSSDWGPVHHSHRRIVVGFDETMFATVRDIALREGTSFAEQVRALVESGLTAQQPVDQPSREVV